MPILKLGVRLVCDYPDCFENVPAATVRAALRLGGFVLVERGTRQDVYCSTKHSRLAAQAELEQTQLELEVERE